MSDEIWHHTDAAGEQRGPFNAETIRAGLASGDIPANARFWRYGLADWVDRATVAAELGLPAAPPPLDPYVAPTARASTRPVGGDEVVYAGFLRRFAAWVLDWVIVSIPTSFLLGIAAALLVPAMAHAGEPNIALLLGFYLVYFTVAALYFAAQESSSAQATLGKRALGIKVTDATGRRLSFGHALGRWFAAGLSHLTFTIGFLMAAITDRKRALHDIVAGTLVVDRWAYSDHPERQQRESSGCLIAIVLVVVLFVPIVAILAAISISQYQDYVARAQFSEAPSIVDGLKTQVVEAYVRTGACPTNADSGFAPPTDYAGKYVAQVEIGGTAPNCVLTATFRGAPTVAKPLEYQAAVFTGTDSGGVFQWTCTAPGLDDKYKPMMCR